MKNILIYQNCYENFTDGTSSGTGKLGFYLFTELSKYYNVYYALPSMNCSIKNVIYINDIDPSIEYDLMIINGKSVGIDKLIYKLGVSIKKIMFIGHCNYDAGYDTFKNLYDVIVFVSEYNYNIEHDSLLSLGKEHLIIHNPINVSEYKDNNYDLNSKDIIFAYHPCKGYHKEFICNMYSDIYESTGGDLHICYPDYGFCKEENELSELIDANKYSSHIHLYGNLSHAELLNIYKWCAIGIMSPVFEETLPYTVMESCLTYTFPISLFKDGAKYVCSNDYISKYGFNENYDVDSISNMINCYSENINDIINEREYIKDKFNYNTIIKKYISLINDLLK